MSRINIPFNYLNAFLSAGTYLSFKEAAEAMNITAPAISHQIKNLEERLGLQLFVRGNRSLEFTEAGEIYWRQVKILVDELEIQTQKLIKDYVRPMLKVSVLPPLASSLVIPNLASFQARYPGLHLIIESNIRNVSLEKGEADIAIRFGDGPWEALVSKKLLDVYIQPVFPPSFAERYDLSSVENIGTLPMINMTARPNAWQRWFSTMGLGEPAPETIYNLDDYPSAVEAAKSLGAALAIMPIERTLIDSGAVIAPFPPVGPLEESIYALVKPADANNPLIQAFIQWLGELLQEIA